MPPVIKEGSTIRVKSGLVMAPGQRLKVNLDCVLAEDKGNVELLLVRGIEYVLAPHLPPPK